MSQPELPVDPPSDLDIDTSVNQVEVVMTQLREVERELKNLDLPEIERQLLWVSLQSLQNQMELYQ